MSEEIQITSKKDFKPNEYKYVHPETMKEVPFKALPKAYQERIETNKKAQQYVMSEDGEEEKPVYKNKEQKARMETPDGKRLAVFLRPAEQGGCVDKKGKLIFKKDERYDPKKSWKYPYGKQLVEIRKKTSHELGDNKWKCVYTEEYAVVHGAVKFEVIRKLADNLKESKRRWTNDILGKDETRSLCGIMCAMSNESPFRSGNTASATRKKNKTFGITTLKLKHLSFIDGKDGETWAKISFKGKGGESIKKIIKNPLVVARLRKLTKGKDSDDYIFTDSAGRLVDAGTLNQYCRTIGIPKYHHFRHIRASQAFKEAIDKLVDGGYIPDMPTTKEVLKLIKVAAEESADLLGNQAQTCINNYIAPQLMFDVFKRYDLPVADVIKNLAKMPSNVTKKDLDEIEKKTYWDKLIDDEVDTDTDEDDIDEADACAKLDIETEQVLAFVNFDSFPKPIIDVEKTSFKEDEKARQNFEVYLLTYEHDDEDIINKPEDIALATFLVPVDWTPDFSEVTEFVKRREDQYRVQKDTNYNPRDTSDLSMWGYNDFVGMTPKEVNERMMEDAKRDIERITNGDLQ